MSWLYFQEQWGLDHKVDFDGLNKLIRVSNTATTLDIKVDVYSAWKEWVLVEDNAKYLPAIRGIGGDITTGSLKAGDIYFLINGWRLVVDLSTTRITGVLFSDNFDTAFYNSNLQQVFPSQVSNLVQTATTQVASLTEEQQAQLLALYNSIDKLLSTNKFLALQ